MIGIYYIKNKVNNTFYIGKSINIEKRLKRHFTKLKNNKHVNKFLQNSYNKYGQSNYDSGILKECSEAELNDNEMFYIKDYKEKGIALYNMTSGGDGGAMPEYIIESNKLKISKANKGNPGVIHFGKDNGMFGRHHTQESKYLMSIHSNNKGKNNPMYGKRGKDNPNYGRKWSKEQKERLSKAMLNKNTGKRKYSKEFIYELVKLHNNGMSYAAIARLYNKNYQTISNLIRFGLPAQPSKYKKREEY